MPYSKEEIKNAITTMANREGSGYKNWYVGITNNVTQRLFEDHCVPKTTNWWIHREAFSLELARTVEQQLVDMGFDGAPGGGDKASKFVYAYKKVPGVTKP